MFEFLFKYPSAVFSKGTFVLLGGWPSGCWLLAILAAAVRLGSIGLRKRSAGSVRVAGIRSALVWLLQTALAAVLLLMLWHPALSVATLRPQQNIVAVVVDDSSSMAIEDAGADRAQGAALKALNSGLLTALQKRFQVRLYRLSDQLERIDETGPAECVGPGDAYWREFEAGAGGRGEPSDRRGGAAERRSGQFGRHRSGDDF